MAIDPTVYQDWNQFRGILRRGPVAPQIREQHANEREANRLAQMFKQNQVKRQGQEIQAFPQEQARKKAVAEAQLARAKQPPKKSDFVLKMESIAGKPWEEMTPEDKKVAMEKMPKSGQTININPDGNQPATSSTQTSIQSDIRRGLRDLADLTKIEGEYSDAYLTAMGRARSTLGGWLDYWGQGQEEGDVGHNMVKFNAERKQFLNGINQFFNKYRKLITGAAASPRELEDLKNAMFNEDLGPKAFQAAFNRFFDVMEAELRANMEQAGSGIPVSGPDPAPYDGSKVDEILAEFEKDQQ